MQKLHTAENTRGRAWSWSWPWAYVPDVSRERVSLRYVFAGDVTCELSSARDSHSGTRPVLMALLLLLLLLL
jgi:hypothetical protein